MADESAIVVAFSAWLSKLKPLKKYGGKPAMGSVAASLIVLERLRERCELEIEAHLAKGGAQIAGMSLAALKRILTRFGEHRPFPSEGGRTNRGNNTPMRDMLRALERSGFGRASDDSRRTAIDAMQKLLVESLDAYYLLERIRIEFDARVTARVFIASILAKARERNQAGPVAQHLVGAKLSIRFPGLSIDNNTYSAADLQGGRSGDFKVGGTAFHVTVSPTPGHVERCKQNVRDGLAVFLIVPDDALARARLRIDDAGVAARVAVESLESFVGQNVCEIAEFATDRFSVTLGELLRAYNHRVTEVETDGSLLIEIPKALE